MKKLICAGTIIAAQLVFANNAFAATQGSLGATSTGTVSISASVPGQVRISGLNDVSFANQNPASDASSAQNICVYSNTSGAQYTVTASGSGGVSGNDFELANGGLSVPYSVEWSSSSGQTTGTALTSTVASAAFASTATQQICASGPSSSASLIVKISSGDLSTMQAATTYSGTLTLLVSPN